MEYLIVTPVASIIFIITLITSLMAFSNQNLYGKLMLHPYNVSRGRYIYTIITSGLIHKDWMHLFFNMLSYYFFAFQLEPLLGHWQFAVLYIVSLILSDMPSVLKHKENYSYYSLGASGAVSAVVFSAILYNPLGQMMILPLPIPIPAVLFGILYLVYCSYASKYSRDNVNHDAHLFGALSGLMITIIFHPGILPGFFQQIIEKVQSLAH
ncbi:rhomboid family intramembrane serine protease [Mucilaginibacter sabulilitoris]|uniref:Rhomboid family intramembrane serine protease n=1 Tax=Mucilaginibacter sabulilitoris TaxID=1173583 RepID=A0ABZ0TNL7_9SPHI|nr:rhomboid family intramembrane serine protease [Mucilaginibacter sabulilitoris]WPU94527.1 rhomboid family intramembrane serine protease [Mucilaginibacter sabulilitoris]